MIFDVVVDISVEIVAFLDGMVCEFLGGGFSFVEGEMEQSEPVQPTDRYEKSERERESIYHFHTQVFPVGCSGLL